jgi:hypothetical protein
VADARTKMDEQQFVERTDLRTHSRSSNANTDVHTKYVSWYPKTPVLPDGGRRTDVRTYGIYAFNIERIIIIIYILRPSGADWQSTLLYK